MLVATLIARLQLTRNREVCQVLFLLKRKLLYIYLIIITFFSSCWIPAAAIEEKVVGGKVTYIFTQLDMESQARVMDGLIKTNQALADENQRLSKIIESYDAVCKVRNERYLR
jgi:hypothetical protein